MLALIPTVIYYYSIYQLGNPVGNIDSAGVMGSYIGLALLAMLFCAIGLFVSSLTANQIISFILAAFLSFIIYSGLDSISLLVGSSGLAIKQLGVLYHYDSLSKGLIDSRDVIYFITITGFLLLTTRVIIGSRQW
jgi:ABC-2 type transport system permease protein